MSRLFIATLFLLQVGLAVAGKKKEPEPEPDSTAWILENPFADLLLMPATGVRYMCMFCYCLYNGCKVFASTPKDAAPSFKLVSYVMACTGGGILVPIFLNAIPVILVNDALVISIIIGYAVHHYFPVVKEVIGQSKILTTCFIVLFETFRANVAVGFIGLAEKNISPGVFDFPLFGPIMCGSIAGCGGAFFPLNKGLDPIKKGMATPMVSAFIGAVLYHMFLSTSLSDGVQNAQKKAHFGLAVLFIACGLGKGLGYVDSLGKKLVKTE